MTQAISIYIYICKLKWLIFWLIFLWVFVCAFSSTSLTSDNYGGRSFLSQITLYHSSKKTNWSKCKFLSVDSAFDISCLSWMCSFACVCVCFVSVIKTSFHLFLFFFLTFVLRECKRSDLVWLKRLWQFRKFGIALKFKNFSKKEKEQVELGSFLI